MVAGDFPGFRIFAGARTRDAEDNEVGTARLVVELLQIGMAALEITNLAKRSTPPALKGRGGPFPSAACRGSGPEASRSGVPVVGGVSRDWEPYGVEVERRRVETLS